MYCEEEISGGSHIKSYATIIEDFEKFRDTQVDELKEKINAFLWVNLPEQITFGEAEKIAGEIFEKIIDTFDRAERKLRGEKVDKVSAVCPTCEGLGYTIKEPTEKKGEKI